ncbi:MAG: hypothetical protein ABIP39_11465 [Polyangiaceae bacterium]
MGRSIWRSGAICALGAMALFPAVSCKKHRRLVPVAAAASLVDASAANELAQAEKKANKQRMKEALVYVDGRQIGVMRLTELPPTLKQHPYLLADGRTAVRWNLVEYIESLGVDVRKVKDLHIYGGRDRTARIDGDELRRVRSELNFDFTRGEKGGKARMRWPEHGIKMNTSIDNAMAMAIYVDKPAPTYSTEVYALTFADGKAIDGIPYAPVEEGHGTRFYVDGVLMGTMKRKQLPDSLLLPGSDTTSAPDSGVVHFFSLLAYLESIGADIKHAKTIDYVGGDDVVERIPGSVVATAPNDLAFSIPAHSHGKILMKLPAPAADSGSTATEAKVSAVEIFIKFAAPKREITPPLVNEPASSGSAHIRTPGNNSATNGNRGMAQDVLNEGSDGQD